MVRRGWKQWDEEQAQRELQAFQASGEPRKAFAQSRGYSPERLRRWAERLDAAAAPRAPLALSPPPPLFLPVRVRAQPERLPESSPGPAPVEVLLRGGRVLRVRAGFDTASLAALVKTLEALPC